MGPENPQIDTVLTAEAAAPQGSIQVWRNAFLNADSFATTLLTCFLDRYGVEGMQWTPEAIKLQVEEDFGLKLPKDNFDKLMAAIIIVTTDVFWKDVAKFVQIANILAGDDFQPDEFEPADSFECAWGVTEAMLLWPPDEPEDVQTSFSEDIRGYVATVLQDEGYVRAPAVLRLVVGDFDLGGGISEAYGDDPEISSAVWKTQETKSAELEQVIQGMIRALYDQLAALPLRAEAKQALSEQLSALSPEGVP